MIYVIAGHPRSGTSMMMSALEAGGMSVAHSSTRERHNWIDGTYRPNAGGLYELEPAGMWAATWPRQHDGKAIKVLTRWVRHLAVHEYRVVFMHRDSEEIRQSYEAAFGIRRTRAQIEDEQKEALNTLANRRDVLSIYELPYTAVLCNKADIFEHLRDYENWPIKNTWAAGDVIDGTKHRFRREQIVMGL